MNKPILCLDFDGVIHWYRKGWQDGSIYDSVTPGFFAWAEKASQHFQLFIYSSRSSTADGIAAMRHWLLIEHAKWKEIVSSQGAVDIEFNFISIKPPAFITIDDRAFQFKGRWDDENLIPEKLKLFKPWNAHALG